MSNNKIYDTLLDRLDKWCKAQPDKILYTFLDDKGKETVKLSYADIDRKTNAIATIMRKSKKLFGRLGVFFSRKFQNFQIGSLIMDHNKGFWG